MITIPKAMKKILATTCVTIVCGALLASFAYGFIVVIPEQARGIPFKTWIEAGVIVSLILGCILAFQWSLNYLFYKDK